MRQQELSATPIGRCGFFIFTKKQAKGGVAIEIEGAAVENMKKNAKLNNIPEGLDMICADLGKYKPEKLADGIVANITSPVILEYLPYFSPWVKKGGWGVFSGVNSANAELVKKAFAENGWTDLHEQTDGDWHGFYLVRWKLIPFIREDIQITMMHISII